MDWSSERYVRLYARETVELNFWPWQSRAVWPWLLARCDRNGRLEFGRHGRAGFAALLKMPLDVVSAGLDGLLEDGCVTERHDSHGFVTLDVPNFVEAQESKGRPASSAERQAAKRARDRGEEAKPAESLSARHECHGVTEESQSNPCAVLCRAVPPVPPVPKEAAASPLALVAEKPKRPRKPKGDAPPSEFALRALARLNALANTDWSDGSGIDARIRGGASEADVMAVIELRGHDQWWVTVNRCKPPSLFGPKVFRNHLDESRAGPPPTARPTLTPEQIENRRLYGGAEEEPAP